MAHLLRNLAPIFLMCDPRDLQAVAQVRSPFTERPTLFLYENQPGGVGMARRLFEIHAQLMRGGARGRVALRLPGRLPRLRRPVDRRARHEQARRARSCSAGSATTTTCAPHRRGLAAG